MSTCAAIIVAAGSSRRAGFDKLLAMLAGQRVLERSIRAFAASPSVGEIVVVCPAERFAQLELSDLAHRAIIRVDGGAERHDSVKNGLAALSYEPDVVAVHDGARPLISIEQIEKCIAVALDCGCATSAHPITDTLKRGDDAGFCTSELVERENLWAMETPQVFRYSLLVQAYAEVVKKNKLVTDEVSALQLIGKKTKFVDNDTQNPKITWAGDIEFAEILLQHRS